MKRRAAGRPQAGQFLPVPRGGTSSVVEDYTSLSHSFRAIEAYTAERCFPYKKSPPQSVDTERGNGYNTYRVRPKRSAVYKYVFSLIKGVTVLWQQGGYLCRNFMIVIVSISCLSARMSAIINSSILHTSFRMVC